MDMFSIVLIILVLILAIVLGKYLLGVNVRVASYVGGKASSARSIDRTKDLQKYPRSRSEAEIVRHLEDITGEKFPTVYPKWLVWKGKKLELDGYNEKLRIALEFSGPLHTKWSPQKESYIKYFERILRDVVKMRLCKRRGINLIVVDMSLPAHHWRNYLLSRLFDIGYIKDKPATYINEQVATPFRNESLERELALDAEMREAEKLSLFSN